MSRRGTTPPGAQQDTVSIFAYNGNGALATVKDSKTGRTTKYYYDTVGRVSSQYETATGFEHRIGYTYDGLGNVSAVTETYSDGSQRTITYEYDGANRVYKLTDGSASEYYIYDDHSRLDLRYVYHNDSWILTKNIAYEESGDQSTSNNISVLSISSPNTSGYDITYNIFYDGNGNITSVKYGNYTISYVYDSANQLIRENNQEAGKTWTWTYDFTGNITSKKEYAYTTGSLGTATDTITYSYANAAWGDLLTSYDGQTLSYDAIGNLTGDANWNYSWEQGRQLASMYRGSNFWNFTYDANGMRTGRSSASASYTYVYNGSQLSRMTYGSNTLLFTYGADGSPLSLTYNGTTYYYVVNLQGDVVAILNSSGAKVVSYTYDAWGRLLTTSVVGTANSNLALHNPLRYRGYVYDRETGLYYLQSRYYNPTIGRFINADNLVNPGAGFSGNNMFAYCSNNPIIYADSSGHWIETVFDLLSLGVSVVDVVINPLDPWAWAGLGGDALDLIPFVTGVGEGVKGMRVVAKSADLADDALDTIRFAKAASYADEFAEGGLDLAKMLDKTSDGFTISNRLDGIKIHNSFMGNGARIFNTRLRADGLDSVTKQIFELKPYNKNSLKKGVKQIINYNDKLGGGYQMILVFY